MWQFGNYDQLKVEIRKEDPKTFQKSNWNVRNRFSEQHTWNRKPLDPTSSKMLPLYAPWILVPSIQTCSTPDGRYENPL